MKHLFIITTLSIIFLFACENSMQESSKITNKKRLLYGSWQLSKINDLNENKNEHEDLLMNDVVQQLLVKTGLMYSFFPDSNFSLVDGSGLYVIDHWKFINKGKNIFLFNKKDTLSVDIKEENKKSVLQLHDEKKGITMVFIKIADMLKNYREDPFYPENNFWRIKPESNENDEQIKSRLANYIKHTAFLLKAASERKDNQISFVYSKGPIKIYDGAIGIHGYMHEMWSSGYYNTDDATKAYNIFGQLLNTNQYHGANTGDWFVDDYNILLSIYGDLKSGEIQESN